ncbi:Protein transport protein SEC23 [Rhynchospora pubera]|uniref:Protein transport protein SEC23 n=1 Tax=Rhynchospora pubera TaxID=906938 RepID=A0AAV8HZ82_9POAL|nr:Protein transport protein SEC23 [Rhynchospora pubera]
MDNTPTSTPFTNVVSSPSPGQPRGPMTPPLYPSPGPPPTTFTPQAHRPPNQSPSSAGSVGSHFSTPPGPPMFSSPIRPSLPFHATPSPPQPPPIFSTGSGSFPTSSPAHFMNGSTELPLHYPAGSDDSGPESPYVLFSAHKVLKRKKAANVPSLGFGAVVSPGLEIGSGLEIIERDPYRCQNCGAYSNLYCEVLIGSGKWQCVICKTLNSSEGSYICTSKAELLSWPELATSAVDYVSGNRRPGFVPVPEARSTSPVFLLIDECLDEVHLTHLQGSLHAFVDSLPPTTRVGIITYGRTISVYDFSEGSVVSADTIAGDNSPSQDLLKPLIYGTGLYLSPMHASLPVAHSIFSSLRPYKLNEPEVSRDRCLGAAVEVALGLVRGPTAEISRGIIRRSGGNCRIVVCVGGPCTYGPGSVPASVNHPNYAYLEKNSIKYMEKLGKEARRFGAVVDLLCAGNCPVRVPVLQPLAKSSGGVLILHDDFGEAFGVNLQRAAARASGSNGLFEIRCSDDILVTQVIGPGEEAAPDSHETFKNDNSFHIQMHSVEETQSFAISMETKGDIKNDFVCFQFSVRYSTSYQSDVTRVITVRLPTVDSVSAYLSSVNDDVAAVLIAKRTVLHASTSVEAANMRYQIDERVKDIAYKFGSQMPKSKMHQFPKELQSLPELLFHLRRGPLLGGIIGHEDERSVLRNLFLNASFDLSLRMVGPRCLMHREGGTFEELPAYDLVMQSNAAVVLDHGTDIFIWLGAELAAQEGKSAATLAACKTLAEELSETRFPAPRILSFKEGSSQARYFVSRLIQAHKDPTYEQEVRFPQLKTLSQEQRSRLKSSFLNFDDYSFCEWMRSLKLAPPEPS